LVRYVSLKGDDSCGIAATEGLAMLPNPETKSFTVAIDARLMRKLSMPSVEAAEKLAVGLVDKGRRVEIVDRATGDVVKRLGPPVS
jgi:hypothetical protein